MEPTSQLSLAEMSCNVLVWHLMDSGSEKIGLLRMGSILNNEL
jgi:hypothetical protein